MQSMVRHLSNVKSKRRLCQLGSQTFGDGATHFRRPDPRGSIDSNPGTVRNDRQYSQFRIHHFNIINRRTFLAATCVYHRARQEQLQRSWLAWASRQSSNAANTNFGRLVAGSAEHSPGSQQHQASHEPCNRIHPPAHTR